MKTVRFVHPNGIRAEYRLATPATMDAIMKSKPKKARIGPEKRSFPKWRADQSVAEYILKFRSMNPHAYVLDYDLSALPDTPAEWVLEEPIVDLGPEGEEVVE